jgi:D-sedoheptulose 7-phosphate isomerase
MDMQHRIAEALNEHLAVIHQLAAVSSQIVEVASELVATLRRQGKVVLMGNGGSASDAQHIAAEMQGIYAGLGTPQGLLALVLTDKLPCSRRSATMWAITTRFGGKSKPSSVATIS